MYLLLKLLVIVLAFIPLEHEAITIHPQPYTSVVAPVVKHTDAAKPLYSVQVMSFDANNQISNDNLLIDIDAPFIWHKCIVRFDTYFTHCPPNEICTYPISCEEFQCTDLRTRYSYTKNPSCKPETNSSTIPNWGFCTCPVNVINPVTGSCSLADLSYDRAFILSTSDGRNVGVDFFSSYYDVNPNAACVPSSSLVSFPANVSGVMAFSTSLYAFPIYFLGPLKYTFALCFPSNSSAPGVLFIGTGPYFFLPQSKVDVRNYLAYTPLLKQQDSFGYFITVNSIVIKRRYINVPANITTKLSTIDPYTTLRTDIYKCIIKRFSMITKRIPAAKPVAPFGICFNISTTGLKVPDIDFILPEDKKWSVSTSNSIKQVTNEVACLAFVDGGATSEHAIVIGTFQFEDNLLEFDLENSILGFSSSLLDKQTSCANFNSTIIHGP